MNTKLIAIAVAGILGTVGGSAISGAVGYEKATSEAEQTAQVAIAESFVKGEEAGAKQVLAEQEAFRNNPTFDKEDWDSEGNLIWMENEITTNMVFISTGRDASVAGAACTPAALTNRYHCVYREIGNFFSTKMDVEVNPNTLQWSSY